MRDALRLGRDGVVAIAPRDASSVDGGEPGHERVERFALGDNNLWALRLAPSEGGGWLLIDAGIDADLHPDEGGGAATTWDALVAQAAAAGVQPRDVRVVVVTHEHIDHAGLAARWAAAGARIVCGRAAVPALAGGYAAAFEAQREPRFADLARHGMPAALIERFRARATRPLRWPPCPREALDTAEDRPTFRLASRRTLLLLGAPGHTPGNLVALVEETREFFSGDTLLPVTIPTPGLHYPRAVEGEPDAPRWPSLPPFLRSVAAIRALDARRVYPGHGAVIEQPAACLDRFEAHHARRGARVRAHLTAHPRSTAFEVARGVFPRLPDGRMLQAITEVIGHLDLLAERGEARAVADTAVRWMLD